MEFTKRDLRNNNNALLRRIQRQIEAEREKCTVLPTEKRLILEQAEAFLLSKPTPQKNTKLSLYKKRSSGRW